MSNTLNIDEAIHQSRPAASTSSKIGDCEKNLGLLYGAARKASSVSDVSKLIQEILFMTQQFIGSSAASLTLVNEKNGELFFQSGGKKAGNALQRININLDSGIAGWVTSNAAPLVINDVQKEDRFDKEIDRVTDFLTKSVIAVPVVSGKQVVAVLEAINRADGGEFTDLDLLSLTAFAATASLVLLVAMIATASSNIEHHQVLIDWYKNMFETLIAAADAKDLYSYGHSSRVKKYTMLAASSLSFSQEDLQALEFGAMFHDIGKLWIHDMVLRKSAALTDGEWYILRKHALKGAQMLNGMPYFEKVRDIVLYHHERYDGKGYPQGLKGKNIPIGARLVAVADAYDAMTTMHAYRDRMSIREAMDELNKGIGTQFCPVAVKAFIAALARSQEEADNAKAARSAKDEAPVVPGAPGEVKTAKDLPVPISEIYEGDVTLTVRAPDGFGQVKQFRKYLEAVPNLKLGLEGWSEAKGTIIVVSLQKPMPLASILDKMPVVEKVDKEHDKLVVVLRLPASSKVFRHGFNLVWPS